MKKYHIGRDEMPSVCDAEAGNCPLGNDEPHFTDKLEAIRVASEMLESKYGVVKSHKREVQFHIGELGAVEVCENGNNCGVKPFGIYEPSHSDNSDKLIGAAQAFREVAGKIDAKRAKEALDNIPEEEVKKLSYRLQNDVREIRRRKPDGSSENPTTKKARRQLGLIKSSKGDYTPETGDSIHASRWNEETGEQDHENFTVDDPKRAHQIIQGLVDKGYPPQNIEIRTIGSCHHSVVNPSTDYFDNVPKITEAGDFRMHNGEIERFDVQYGCIGESPIKRWATVPKREGDEVIVDGNIMVYMKNPDGVNGEWTDIGPAKQYDIITPKENLQRIAKKAR